MDSGCYTDPERESSGSSGRSFSASSKTNAPSASLMSPRSTVAKSRSFARQVMLEEVMTEEYQPTVEEQLEYAVTIGIDPDSESELMHLAVEGLRAALPPNWRPIQVSNDDEDLFYYFNVQTGKSTWEHPNDDHFRQLVIQERARLRSNGRSARASRGVVRFRDSSPERGRAPAEDEQTSAILRAELRSCLEIEEKELREEMRARLAEEEAKLRAELRSQMAAERMTALQRLEKEAEETREEQRRLLELEMAERRVEAMAELTQLRAQVEQLTRAREALQQHQIPQTQTEIRTRPQCQRLRTPQRCVSVDEAAVNRADGSEQCDIDEDFDEDRSSGSRAGLSVDAIGRARSFLNRHLSSERGFAVPNPPDSDGVAFASRKRPQIRASRATHRASAKADGAANLSMDAGRVMAADADDASMGVDVAKEATGQETAVALAAELRKLRCGSLPSLARSENEDTTCSESSEQPKAKQDRISSAASLFPPQAPASARRHSQHQHRTGAAANPPNPRRQRIDWRKVGERLDSQEQPQPHLQQQQQQPQSTELKLAQHRAWLYNYARSNGLPPSGGKSFSPQV